MFKSCHTSHGQMGGAIAGFIPQGPNNDGRLVFVPLDHSHPPVHDAVQPEGVVGRHNGVVVQCGVEAVGLVICFVQQVNAMLIAQLVPGARKMWLWLQENLFMREPGKLTESVTVNESLATRECL